MIDAVLAWACIGVVGLLVAGGLAVYKRWSFKTMFVVLCGTTVVFILALVAGIVLSGTDITQKACLQFMLLLVVYAGWALVFWLVVGRRVAPKWDAWRRG